MKLAEAFVEARIDSSKIKPDLNKVEGDVKSAGDNMGKSLEKSGNSALKAFTRVFSAAAFGAGIKGAIDKASDLNETVSKTQQIFGTAADGVIAFSDTTAKSMGLSKTAYLDAASGLKGLLDNLGLTADQSTKWSQQLVALGSDLGSFFNKDPAEAIDAIGSALRGEAEPIRAFNVQISDAAVKQKALELGLYSGKGAIEANAKAQATLALIMDQTSAAQGDFAKTSDGVANSQRIAAAESSNAAASLGKNFLPIYQKVVQVVGEAAQVFGSLPAPIQLGIVALAGMAALAGPIKGLVDVAKDIGKAFKKIPEDTKSAGIALAAIGTVVMVGLSLRAQEVAKSNARMLDGFNELSRVADKDLFGNFILSLGRAAIAGKGGTEAMDQLAQTNLDGAKRVIAFSEALDKQGQLTDGQRHVIDLLRDAVAKEEAAQAQATKTEAAAATTTEATTEAIKLQTIATQLNVGAQLATADAADNAARAQERALSAMDAEADSAKNLSDKLNDAVSALNDMIDGATNAADSQLALNKAEDDFAAAAANTLEVAKKKGKTSAEYKQAVDDERDSLIAAAKAQQKLSADQAQALGVTVTATQKIDDFNNELENQAAYATPAARRAAYEYISQLNQIPPDVETQILALVDQGKIDEANALIDGTSKTRTAAIIADAETTAAEAQIDQAARDRIVRLIGQAVVNGVNFGVSAEGRFVHGGSNFVTSTGEVPGRRGDEVILPLGNPSRMAALLADSRVGPRVADAMADFATQYPGKEGSTDILGGPRRRHTAAQSASKIPVASAPQVGHVTIIVEGQPFTGILVQHERALAAKLSAGTRA